MQCVSLCHSMLFPSPMHYASAHRPESNLEFGAAVQTVPPFSARWPITNSVSFLSQILACVLICACCNDLLLLKATTRTIYSMAYVQFGKLLAGIKFHAWLKWKERISREIELRRKISYSLFHICLIKERGRSNGRMKFLFGDCRDVDVGGFIKVEVFKEK